MVDIISHEEASLAQIGLDHALSYRDNSAFLLKTSIHQVQSLGDSSIYPPYFPSWRHADEAENIRVQPDTKTAGRLTQAEAVALQVLVNEHLVFNQALFSSSDINQQMVEMLHMQSDHWTADVVSGIGDFGNNLRSAAGVREMMARGLQRPEGSNMAGKVQRIMWDLYEGPIRADGMILGNNTAQAILEAISVECERQINSSPEGARTEEEINARVASHRHGAKLAKELYAEALIKAQPHFLSQTLSVREV